MEDDADNRFKHLFNPIKDLAKNFNLDICTELTSYQEEVRNLCEQMEVESYPSEEDRMKFNFAEAGVLIQGSSSVYSRKVDFVHSVAYSFSNTLKATKKKTKEDGAAGDEDDDGCGEDGGADGDQANPRRKRVRAHDGDPLAFPKRPTKCTPYMDVARMRKMVHKPFLDADFKPALMRDVPTLATLPEDLRPMPDNEKEPLCVTGYNLRSTEAIGKVEDFWTLSYTSALYEKRWNPDNTRNPMPHHAPRPGGCEGCAKKDCPDINYFTKAYLPLHKMGKMTELPNNNIYLDNSHFLNIRVGFSKEFDWVRVCDLRARSNYWTEQHNEIRKKRIDQRSLLSFASENVLNDTKFSQAVTARGRLTSLFGSQPFGSQSQGGSQPLSQKSSLGSQASQETTTTEMDFLKGRGVSLAGTVRDAEEDPEYMEYKGQRFPGRASSRMEAVRESLGPGRPSTRLSYQVLRDDFEDSDEGGYDEDEDVCTSSAATKKQQTAVVTVEEDEDEPWSDKAMTKFVNANTHRDPFEEDPDLVIVPAQKLNRRQRCYNTTKLREKQQLELRTMELPRRFNMLSGLLNAVDGPPIYSEEPSWGTDVNRFNLNLLRAATQKKRRAAEKEQAAKLKSEKAAEEKTAEEKDDVEEIPDPFANPQPADYDDMGDDEDYSDGDYGDAPPDQEPELQFKDLKDEDMVCDLIDVKECDPHTFLSQHSVGGRSMQSAYDAVLQNPGMSAPERMNMFMQNAQEMEDKRSAMQKEVQDWEDTIVPRLEMEQSHKPFDVHEYGGGVLAQFSEPGETKSFAELAKGKERYEFSRVFLSTLMMANTNNVEITSDPNNPINSMRVKLLKTDRPHEKLDEEGAV